jgi:hypothetical protein
VETEYGAHLLKPEGDCGKRPWARCGWRLFEQKALFGLLESTQGAARWIYVRWLKAVRVL